MGQASMTVGDDTISSIERSVLALRRRQRRSTLATDSSAAEIRAAEVVDAIASRSDVTTVADVARELSIDPSQASRRVAAAVAARLVSRTASQQDGRVSVLEVTPAGVGALEEIRDQRCALIDRATQSWTQTERNRLAILLNRFINDLDEPGVTSQM